MEHPNIYTFKHSELPPMTDAIEAEIKGIETEVGNSIQNFEGHYRALCSLAETLAGSLNDCEERMHCIRIISDRDEGEYAPRAIGLTDLSMEEKRLILSMGITSSLAISMLADALECDRESAAYQVGIMGLGEMSKMSPEDVEASIEKTAKALRENHGGGSFLVEV